MGSKCILYSALVYMNLCRLLLKYPNMNLEVQLVQSFKMGFPENCLQNVGTSFHV